jgi:autotransporter passenger strand-loop-strand repeat protein
MDHHHRRHRPIGHRGGVTETDYSGVAIGSVIGNGGVRGWFSMPLITVSGITSDVTTVDSTNTYLVESGGILDILGGGGVSGLITVEQNGEAIVNSGGTVLSTTVSSGGAEYVGVNGASGTASGTTISNVGIQYVGFGAGGSGTAVSTTISSGGEQDVGAGGSGVATSTTIDGGIQRVGSNFGTGTAVSTTISGGFQFIGDGGSGTASSTTINGGNQYVGYGAGGSGTAVSTTINSGGTQYVGFGVGGSGTASSTIINSGGTQDVGDNQGSGTASGTTVSGGGQQIVGDGFGSGTASATTIDSGGIQYVGSDGGSGAAIGTTISSGGTQIVGYFLGTGTAISTTINGGGTEYVSSAGTAIGVTFAGASATLDIAQPAGLSGTISGWQAGDIIDFVSTSVTSAAISGSTLSITVSGGSTFSYQLAGQEANTVPSLQSDGSGGTEVVLVVSGVGSGQTLEVSSGQTSNGIVVFSGGTLQVDSGGTALGTVDSGGTDKVYGNEVVKWVHLHADDVGVLRLVGTRIKGWIWVSLFCQPVLEEVHEPNHVRAIQVFVLLEVVFGVEKRMRIPILSGSPANVVNERVES